MIGYIYTITTANGLYVGSTKDFKARCIDHKIKSKYRKQLVYQNILSNKGIYKIKIYCQVNCRDKRQLEFYEQQYMVILGSNLNSQKAFQTKEELKKHRKDYQNDNREELNEKKKEYYNKNKKEISEKSREIYKNNDEYRKKINEKNNKYQNDNREELNETRRKKFVCECGGNFSSPNKTRHFRSIMHQSYLSSL
tara:strand:- start:79 stop:663 length:585 start_codon:yes stop_codon:yes gene_type:complete